MCKRSSSVVHPLSGSQSSGLDDLSSDIQHSNLRELKPSPSLKRIKSGQEKSSATFMVDPTMDQPDEECNSHAWTSNQYRCKPPSEFPLASPCLGILHHLLGFDRHALTRTCLIRLRLVDGAPEDPADQLPCALQVSRHAKTTHVAFHDQGNDISMGMTTARAWVIALNCIGPRPSRSGYIPKQPDSSTTLCGANGFKHDRPENVEETENSSSHSESTEEGNPFFNNMSSYKNQISDLTIFKYCLGGNADRCLLLKEIASFASEQELEDFAQMVALYSGCSHHR
ncbi:SH2 domain-containing protein A [Vitis vinifera]|uniref:SH2 domain-containing protein A n=1 Tax=Vitis vinifera TaxID=29760 RepID=A0A438HC23_VITVI|nr:SH2 domain-containing protein A [Vitis vinifera]